MITATRRVRGPHGNELDIACDGPRCEVAVTTDPWGHGEELASWSQIQGGEDEDHEVLWFHARSCRLDYYEQALEAEGRT